MSDFPTSRPAANPVTNQLLDQLRRHPKRVVFTDGEDPRVLKAAARLVAEQVVAPILLGDCDRIRTLAAAHDVSLNFIHLIDPPQSSDFKLFCQRLENIARYRTLQAAAPAEIVARPHYFGALMVQYGQADAIVSGNKSAPAAFFRALIQTIKPLPHVTKTFATTLIQGDHLKNLGGDGLLFLADCGLIPHPTVEELAVIALETGKLARHFLGRPTPNAWPPPPPSPAARRPRNSSTSKSKANSKPMSRSTPLPRKSNFPVPTPDAAPTSWCFPTSTPPTSR
jgi:phosphotransacetylase